MLERYERGDRTMMIEPLDYLLMLNLPDEGTNIGGYYQVGETVSELVKKFQPLDSSTISSRLRVLSRLGMTRKVRMASTKKGSAMAWQTTPKGKEATAEWLKENPQT